MGQLAECGLQGWLGVSRNKFVSFFSLRVYHIPLKEAERFVAVIKSLLFWKHQAFQCDFQLSPRVLESGNATVTFLVHADVNTW